MKQQSAPAGAWHCTGRAVARRRTIHIPDVKADPEYTLNRGAENGRLPHGTGRADVARGRPIGVLVLTRPSAAVH